MATNIEITYERVWDMTIGAGNMPESADAIIARFNATLQHPLTGPEEEVVRAAHARCYQEFHSP